MFFFCWINTSLQIPILNKVEFREESLYIVARGTKSKQGLIGKKFNVADTNITHIGLGYYEPRTKSLKIYNISTEKKSKNALLVESLYEFMTPRDLFYIGIWEYAPGHRQFQQVKRLLADFEKRVISFDYDFDLQNADSSLYCSEFCWKVLKAVDKKKFDFKPVIRLVSNSFYKNVLGRDTLTYIPVDFFTGFVNFKKVKETSTR